MVRKGWTVSDMRGAVKGARAAHMGLRWNLCSGDAEKAIDHPRVTSVMNHF
jgi:hypothetical protein